MLEESMKVSLFAERVSFLHMLQQSICDGVSYVIVSFLIRGPNPQHTVSLYTFGFRINASWSGGKVALHRIQRNIIEDNSISMGLDGRRGQEGHILNGHP
jgi:hypothetical protein